MNSTVALEQYKQVGTKAAIEDADPYTLTKMLFDGAVEKINAAKFFMQDNKVAEKGESISRAISIIDGLKSSLDMEQGGEIAENLQSLYEYMQRQLLQANMKNDTALLDEVLSLLGEIRAGWNAIPKDVRDAVQPQLKK